MGAVDINELRQDLVALSAAYRDHGGGPSQAERLFRELARKYHPDGKSAPDDAFLNRAMATLNIVYARLRAGLSAGAAAVSSVELATNGSEDEEAYRLLKAAEQLRDRAMTLVEAPYEVRSNPEIVASACEHLYGAQNMLTMILTKYPSSVWAHDAESKRRWCYSIGNRLTRRLVNVSTDSASLSLVPNEDS